MQGWHLKWKLLVSFSPFLVVLAAFVAFVCWNGSIVLGNSPFLLPPVFSVARCV